MICVSTIDDWTSAVVSLDEGLGGGPQAWSPSASVSDAYSAAEEFVAFVGSTFGDSASWTWARDDNTGGAVITISLPLGYSTTSNAAAQAILGSPAVEPPFVSSTNWISPAGTIAPSAIEASAYVDQDIRKLQAQGAAASLGVARVGIGGLASRAPRVQWPAYPVDMERLRAVQADAASPRTANIYDASTAQWLLDASLGPISLRRSGHALWRATAEVRV